jgi:long-chain acyl-CoA synthetase
MSATLDAIVTRAAERLPDKDCLVVPDGASLTYAELDRAVSAFAALLRERGASPGDRLLLANCNTPEFFIALFGAIRAGMIAMPIDLLSPRELKGVIEHGAPRAVVVDERSAPVFGPLGLPRVALRPIGDLPLAETWAPARAGSSPGPEVAVISYTSGTTGTPKGVMHGHAGIQQKVASIKEWFGLDENDRALCFLPTHFGHGLIACCLSALNYGGTIVLTRPFDVELLPRLFGLVERYRITTFSLVPTMARLLLRHAERNPPPQTPSLRFVTCASAPLHAEETEAFEARFGVPLLNCYGITEGGTWSAMTPRDGTRDRKSVGTQAGCRIRAVGSDAEPLPAGEIGDLQIAGPSVMLGYYQDEAATTAALRDGWLFTGDLGSVDARGRVFLAGRRKELIIRAGANIYPAEIEAVLLGHPKVAEAYVLGIDHPILGEVVGACIVCKPGATLTAKELLDHCREKLAQYKWPQEVRFVEAVTKTSRGKVNKAGLKPLFSAA